MIIKRTLGALAAVVAAVAWLPAAWAVGTTDEYYITNGSTVVVVQGDAVVRSWNTRHGQEFPLAVFGDVRTMGFYRDRTGAKYDLNGNYQGIDYPWQNGPAGQILDGTTDGRYNYAADWSFGSGNVWRYDRDWKIIAALFQVPGANFTGLAYDLRSGNFWVANEATGRIEQYTGGGALVSAFSSGQPRVGGLAYEPSTDTLWVTRNGSSEIRQYDKNGNQLQSLNVPGVGGNQWGGEFNLPEPTTPALLALGGLPSLRRRPVA